VDQGGSARSELKELPPRSACAILSWRLVGKVRLHGWKEIAAYLNCDVRTARRWEKERSLPVHRIPGDGRRAVFAYADELEVWLCRSRPVSLRRLWPSTLRIPLDFIVAVLSRCRAAATRAVELWRARRRIKGPNRGDF
jgi:hypothetical protein